MSLVETPRAGVSIPSQTQSALDRYRAVRAFTEMLCEPLVAEDYVVQSMTDVSPTKWHLAHTSWFFETFVLRPHAAGYTPLHPAYAYLFNSYYVQAGERHCRMQRGLLSRPTVEEVYAYRRYVDEHMAHLMETGNDLLMQDILPLIEVGLHHEQQHQELMLTDIKHVFSINPLYPVYRPYRSRPAGVLPALSWVPFEEGVYPVGHEGDGFYYDNEGPRHRCFAEPFALASRLTTNGEYQAFIEDGGYRRPELWLSAGWATRTEGHWEAPLYWERGDGGWQQFTLSGLQPVDPDEPVTHVSYFEADAFARWAGARLPTEQEWEIAASRQPLEGPFVDAGYYRPVRYAGAEDGPLLQLFGDVWQWTRSPYSPYPGYEPAPGALGEYNGKFMCNQFVLRGASCATSNSHARATYRNFFPPDARWQFSGIRLAR
ncbi:MAG: ergothioneine biosynthesis protein EgtB [Rhodothermales bacterium]